MVAEAERLGLSPRVSLVVRSTHVLPRDVGVDLGRGYVGVTQQRLDATQISASNQQVGGKRVAHLVWVNAAADASGSRVAADDFPDSLTCEWATAGRRKERGGADPLLR